jgi:3alpha(or 20beta)-hydroxysteroid dehydrogenase
MGRLDGLVALITGAARGLGACEAEWFVREGASVVACDVLEAEAQELVGRLGGRARFERLDVTDEDAWQRVVDASQERFGRIDVLVNNAGVSQYGALVTMSLTKFERVVDVNQTGVFLGMRAVAPVMAATGSGSIINISSVLGVVGAPMSLGYTGTKFAVRGMTKVAALELAAHGVRVNSIHPGVVETPMTDFAGAETTSLFDIPLGRVGRPEDVAAVALFLASPESSYCTGAEFVVDGGLTAGRINQAERSWVAEALERLQARSAGPAGGSGPS